jgi:5-(carboxyamino)imidazole ribonucleotide synthase
VNAVRRRRGARANCDGHLLGELWQRAITRPPGHQAQREPRWEVLLSAPRTKLHLYGETQPRLGRKMGHFTLWDGDIQRAIERAKELKDRLRPV